MPAMPVRALAVSDEVDVRIHSATLRERMPDIQIVFGCGDLPGSYLEFLVDALNRPLYFVLGNHQEELLRLGIRGKHYEPAGCINVGGRVVQDKATGLIIAGLPGSPRYSGGPEQYGELEMMWMILRMTPRLLWNRIRHGRFVDVLITHAPPRDVNDCADRAHRGFVAFRRFLRWFRPTYELHGHVHRYDRSKPGETHFAATTVINVFPCQVLDLTVPALERRPAAAVSAHSERAEERRA